MRQCFRQIEFNLLICIINRLVSIWFWTLIANGVYSNFSFTSFKIKKINKCLKTKYHREVIFKLGNSDPSLANLALSQVLFKEFDQGLASALQDIVFDEKLLSQNNTHWLEQSSQTFSRHRIPHQTSKDL